MTEQQINLPAEMRAEQLSILDWLANGETGLSSESIAFWVGFGIRKRDECYPLDPDDFNRCLKLFDAAPTLRPHLHKMAELSAEWARLVAGWEDIERTFIDEVGLDWVKGAHADKTYRLMQDILDGSLDP